MNDRERDLLERMHAEIDGVNAPEESARLREELRSDAAARETFDELRRLDDALGRVGLVRPPADLALRIERAIHGASPTWRDAPRASGPRLVPVRRVRLGYAWALAAGVVLGVALHVVVADRATGGGRGSSEVAATMGGGVSEVAASVAPAAVDLPDGAGTARVAPAGRDLEVGIELHAGKGGELALSWDPEVLALRAFSTPGGVDGPFSVAPGRIEWPTPGGRADVARFAVLRATDTEIRIALRANGVSPAAIELPVGIAP